MSAVQVEWSMRQPFYDSGKARTAVLAFALASIATYASAAVMSDDDIKQGVMTQARAAYHDDCMCPYDLDKKTHHFCLDHSAYKGPHGNAIVCYDQDVTPAMMTAYRRQHGG
jgi:hypothetical protein